MAWTVRRIMEDDYGCEERTEEEMDQVCVLLENEKGESISLKAADSLLCRMGIDEGSTWPWELPAAGSIRKGI